MDDLTRERYGLTDDAAWRALLEERFPPPDTLRRITPEDRRRGKRLLRSIRAAEGGLGRYRRRVPTSDAWATTR